MAFDKKAYALEYSRYDRQKAREAGLCIVCRKRRALEGQSQCFECRERNREYERQKRQTAEYKAKKNRYRRERYKKWVDAGLCGYCGKPIYKGNACRHHFILKEQMKAKRRARTAEKRQVAAYEHGNICQKCIEPALPGKKLCQRHYDIVMKYSVPKANAATRRLLADAMKNHQPLRWARFKEIVMRKKNDKRQV